MDLKDLVFELDSLIKENEELRQVRNDYVLLQEELVELKPLKAENEVLLNNLEDLSCDFVIFEQVKEENAELRATVTSLRQQVEGYKKRVTSLSKQIDIYTSQLHRQYKFDHDY